MRRRIRQAIVGVSAIILLGLGIPLSIAVHAYILNSEVVEVQATTATALAEIDLPLNARQLRHVATEPDAPDRFAVYGPTGRLIYGEGPLRGDSTVRRALAGHPASSSQDEIVVATPITEGRSERVLGVLRVTESLSGAESRSHAAWIVMGAAVLVALGLSWLMGNRLARTLSEPLSDLATSAAAIGDLGTLERRPPSGMPEIDGLADVLAGRAERVHEALQRERRFSADVSHQLRTPITTLRFKVEAALSDHPDETLAGALHDLDRLEDTIDHLLAVARDSIPTPGRLDLAATVAASVARWQEWANEAQRTVTTEPATAITVLANRASIDEILDVLVDNALRHGTGRVTVALRRMHSGVAVDVADGGDSIPGLDAELVFERGHGSGQGTGIGLSVARRIAEAEGGRLLLTGHRPTTFSLVLLEHATSAQGADHRQPSAGT
ncbi:MAG: two-component sensor histidine kinase [Acidimicrobiales bacterium]|nr:two-component sensor histidine kinase [Acidimicrobiales bacterium]